MAFTAAAGWWDFQGERFFPLSLHKAFLLLRLDNKPVRAVGSRKRVVIKTSIIHIKLFFIFLVPVADGEIQMYSEI